MYADILLLIAIIYTDNIKVAIATLILSLFFSLFTSTIYTVIRMIKLKKSVMLVDEGLSRCFLKFPSIFMNTWKVLVVIHFLELYKII